MANLQQEIQRLLLGRKSSGQKSVWLAPHNRALLGTLPDKHRPQALSGPSENRPTGSAAAAQRAALPSRSVPPSPISPAMNLSPPTQLLPAPAVSALAWEELFQAAHNCRACQLAFGRKQVVFGAGSHQARLLFIGEGPGEEEDQQGLPFVGRAGQMLTNMIKAMGFDRASQDPAQAVYIANIVKCRPPQNRNPLELEAQACLPYLQRQIALLKPQVIVLLGAVPLRFLLGKIGINKCRGTWLEYQGIPVMPTFHPAYLLRFELQKNKFIEEKRKVWNDLQLVMARLNA